MDIDAQYPAGDSQFARALDRVRTEGGDGDPEACTARFNSAF